MVSANQNTVHDISQVPFHHQKTIQQLQTLPFAIQVSNMHLGEGGLNMAQNMVKTLEISSVKQFSFREVKFTTQPWSWINSPKKVQVWTAKW